MLIAENDIIFERGIIFAGDAKARGVDPFDFAIAAVTTEFVGGDFIDTALVRDRTSRGRRCGGAKGAPGQRAPSLRRRSLSIRGDDRRGVFGTARVTSGLEGGVSASSWSQI